MLSSGRRLIPAEYAPPRRSRLTSLRRGWAARGGQIVDEDYLALLRRTDELLKSAREKKEAKRARDAEAAEWMEAWQAVILSLEAVHKGQGEADLSTVIQLAEILKSRGQDAWLPEMAELLKAP
jgi:hypothetical protein